MKREIAITLRYDLTIGKVNLNEIVCELKQLRDPLMLQILEEILKNYDDLISERLSQTKIYPIHNIVVGSDIDKTFQESVSVEDLSGIMADGTGAKQHKGRKGET